MFDKLPFPQPVAGPGPATPRLPAPSATVSTIQIPSVIGSAAASDSSVAAAAVGWSESFTADAPNGAATLSIPLPITAARSLSPQLSLVYSSSGRNGVFGHGWVMAGLGKIARKTSLALPKYLDHGESADQFEFSGNDVVPVIDGERNDFTLDGICYRVQNYRLRVEHENGFVRLEHWRLINAKEHERSHDLASSFWRSIDKFGTTSTYGLSASSRVQNESCSQILSPQIFEWLNDGTIDTKGNAIKWEYKAENKATPAVGNQMHQFHTQRYPKYVRYGNTKPVVGASFETWSLSNMEWLLHLVFDYGEHCSQSDEPPSYDEICTWDIREDAFSSYRSCFEVRTRRYCQRFLLFHQFPEIDGGLNKPTIVKATSFLYDRTPEGYRMKSVRGSGYIRGADGSIVSEELPELAFTYSRAADLHRRPTTIHRVPPRSMPAAAAAIFNTAEWNSLDGDGITGILSATEDGWYFSRNLTPLSPEKGAKFSEFQNIGSHPNSRLNDETQAFDPDGRGEIGICSKFAGTTGFYMRESGRWGSYQPIKFEPTNCDSQTVNVRSLDLTGNGIPDFLVAHGDEGFVWYPSKGSCNAGFAEAQQVSAASAPRVIFDDGTESIYLADMTGDGLTDIVRILNGSICYWPNIGYGRFSGKVVMNNSPKFDSDGLFHQKRILLTDVNGSGTTDLIYFPSSGSCHMYENLCGNSWSKRKRVQGFPQLHDLAKVSAFDLLGTGTSCIVWMSSLPSDTSFGLCYVDLSPTGKPGLLSSYSNGMGLTVTCEYAASTTFYLEDERAGKPWRTRLPFPVHCLKSTCTMDEIKKTRLVQRFAYHEGFWDRIEREFCGFGMVETWDTDEFQASADGMLNFPTIHKKSWYHTGNVLGAASLIAPQFFSGQMDTLASFYKRDVDFLYDRQSYGADAQRQAVRVLKGVLLHEEVYAVDGTEMAHRPYIVSHQTSALRCLQPPTQAREGVFAHLRGEALKINTERQESDYRVSHQIVLETDEYLNLLASVDIAYGRGTVVPCEADADQEHLARQKESTVVYSRNLFTNDIVKFNNEIYLAPCPAGSEEWQLFGIPHDDGLYQRAKFKDWESTTFLESLSETTQDGAVDTSKPSKVILGSSRLLYRSNDLAAILPRGKVESLAIPGRSYELVLTNTILGAASGAWPGDLNLENLTSKSDSGGGYLDLYSDGNLWAPGGEQLFGAASDDSRLAPEDELKVAQASFYIHTILISPFESASRVTFDQYFLLPIRTRDPVGNCISAENNYIAMKPCTIIDANANITLFSYDVFGSCAAICEIGKENHSTGEAVGIDEFFSTVKQPDPRVVQFMETPTLDLARAILGKATVRSVNLSRYRESGSPFAAINIRREQHGKSPLQLDILHCDGSGQLLQTKRYAGTHHKTGNAQWLTNEWKVLNNKGLPVHIFEPFYDTTHVFRPFATEGHKSTIFYDSVGREIGRLYPDRTFTKLTIGPWKQTMHSRGDTILQDLTKDPDLCGFTKQLDKTDVSPTWLESAKNDQDMGMAVAASLDYADTPSVIHLNPLGHLIANSANNGSAGVYTSLSFPDTHGRVQKVVDTLQRTAAINKYDLRGQLINSRSLDGGDRWTLYDASNNPLLTSNSRGIVSSVRYDALRRPVKTKVIEPGCPGFIATRNIYGEDVTESSARNLRGRLYKTCDQSGEVTNEKYDIRGNLIHSTQRFAVDYRGNLDWATTVDLQEHPFNSTRIYDALDRVVEFKNSAGGITRYFYDPLNRATGVLVCNGDTEARMVEGIEYNARNQKTNIRYGNATCTKFEYHERNFRLARQQTIRVSRKPVTLQDMRYTYDCLGNIITAEDCAKEPLFTSGKIVKRQMCYTYDALERLLSASGREHLGQNSGSGDPYTASQIQKATICSPNDPTRIGQYHESYRYDSEGNILEMSHQVPTHTERSWSRVYSYSERSSIAPTQFSNRVTATTLGDRREDYVYDQNGSIISMGSYSSMLWDYDDRLSSTSRQRMDGMTGIPEKTYYRYNSNGQRVRKVTEHSRLGKDKRHRKLKETFYADGYDLFCTYTGDGVRLKTEHTTVKVQCGGEVVGFSEATSVRDSQPRDIPEFLLRFLIKDYLECIGLELDEYGQVVSQEEYSPYGSTTVFATEREKTAGKRYRFMMKERDCETGLYYCEARYLIPWLGRWLSVDPSGFPDGMNGYSYVACRPSVMNDPSGLNLFGCCAQDPLDEPEIDLSRNTAERAAPERPTLDSPVSKKDISHDPWVFLIQVAASFPTPPHDANRIAALQQKAEQRAARDAYVPTCSGPHFKTMSHGPYSKYVGNQNPGTETMHEKPADFMKEIQDSKILGSTAGQIQSALGCAGISLQRQQNIIDRYDVEGITTKFDPKLAKKKTAELKKEAGKTKKARIAAEKTALDDRKETELDQMSLDHQYPKEKGALYQAKKAGKHIKFAFKKLFVR